MKHQLFRIAILFALLALTFGAGSVTPARAAGRCYVNDDAGGANTGATWTDAYTSLQSAFADSCAEIWVAAGIYKPGAFRTATFQLENGVAVYGGFAGTETTLDQRNPVTNVAILSGDIDNNDSQTPIIMDIATVTGSETNSYHVVTGATGATLDGFTITAGSASSTSPYNSGGGMYNNASSPTVMNVTFIGNSAIWAGGGMYNYWNSSPMVTNATFSGNSANRGGGMYNNSSSPTVTNITFSNNWAASGGGGLYNDSSSPTLTNVTFSNNSAVYGGGMYNYYSVSPTITNVTFSGNVAGSEGGGMYNNSSSPTLTNVMIANSTSGGDCVNNSSSTLDPASANNLIEDAANACGLTHRVIGNIVGSDPLLGALGDYGGFTSTIPLLPGSPAIDAGSCASGGSDQRGVNHLGACDIGAYEYDYTGTYYVKPTASGTGNCQSWDNACRLQTALVSAHSDDEIWTAAGVHTPGTTQTDTFQLVNGVGAYGGFVGTETALDQRNPVTNVTILSGDIDNNDSQTPIITNLATVTGNTTNSYHVVTGASSATLDGFTITGGNANDSFPYNAGGGMFNYDSSSPTVTNVTFIGNSATTYGGGMFNYDSSSPTVTNVTFIGNSAEWGGGMFNYDSSSPTVTNVTFIGNSAEQGGGMFNYVSSPTVLNVTFSGNSAGDKGGGMFNGFGSPTITDVEFSGNSADWGGGMFNYDSSPTVTNVTFSGNSAAYGGGISNSYSSNPMITNVTFSGNSAYRGGGMYNSSSSGPDIRNSILWGNTASYGAQIYNSDSNPTLNDSLIQGGYPGGTNILTADPLLGPLGNYDGATQTFPLQSGSPAIDMGNPTYCTTGSDQRGQPYVGTCDLGAHESDFDGPYLVKPTATGAANCTTWDNACALPTALSHAISGSEIWVAAGVYKPGTSQTDTFQLVNGVGAYGGFVGTETTLDQRNPATHVTILSGDIDNDDANADGNHIAELAAHIVGNNSYHVVTGISGATLDGFTVTAGRASGNPAGGNRGGGLYNNNVNEAAYSNLVFSGNAGNTGGGVDNHASGSLTFRNVTFIGNQAGYGGGMYNWVCTAEPYLFNVTFNGNIATNGGGMYNDSCTAWVDNATFKDNSAGSGGGIYNNGSGQSQIRNSILWGNINGQIVAVNDSAPHLYDSVLQDACPAGVTCEPTVIGTDPKLGTLGNYGGFTLTIPLLPGSSAIDTGNDSTCANGNGVNREDQRGVTRPQGAHCDIGAYELEVHALTYTAGSHGSISGTTPQAVQHGTDGAEVTAVPNSGYQFVNWSDGILTASRTDTNITADLTVTANFVLGNHAPTNITLSNNQVAENEPSGTLVGALTTTDLDAGDTHTYSFCGGADDGFFTITGGTLHTAAVFDFETKSSYNICIRTDDGNGGTFDKAFTITITDVDDNPVFKIFLPLTLR